MIDEATLDALADQMHGLFRTHAFEQRTDVPIDGLSLAEAYEIQDRVMRRRLREGDRHVGWKVGCTSRAIRTQFGLTQPVAAYLTRPHVHDDGVAVSAAAFRDLAVESELVLHIGVTLAGHDHDDDELLAAIHAVSPGIELHHYRFAYGVPTSQELIASNAIHAGIVVGEPRPLGGADLALDGVGLWIDGELRSSAIEAEILGSGPLASLRWLVGHLSERGRVLEAGQLVIPGSAAGLVPVTAGQEVVARFTSFGSCTARVT